MVFGGMGRGFGREARLLRRTNLAAIQLSAATFAAGAAQGTAIGALSVTGGTGTYTFTLTDSAGNKVQVAGTNGVNLQVGSSAASAGSFSVTVRADNGAGSTLDRAFLITVLASGVFLAMDMSDFRNVYILGL